MSKAHTHEASITGNRAMPSGADGITASAFIAILILVPALAVAQLATNDIHEIQEVLYLGYFLPIAIGARYFKRRGALICAALVIVIYTAIFIPRLLTQLDVHQELTAELFGRLFLFSAAAISLSSFRLGVSREKEKALLAERQRADRLRMMLDVSNAVTSSLKIDQVLQLLAVRIVETVEATFCRISLLSEEGDRMRVVAASPARELDWDACTRKSVSLADLPDHLKTIETKEAVIVAGRRDEPSLSQGQLDVMGGTTSLLIYPLVVGGEVVGLVEIGEQRKWERSPLSQEKADLCQTIVNEGAVAVGHALSHKELEDAFVGTIRSLAEAIDAKDPSTRGHSDWVSKYAVMLGKQLHLEEPRLEALKYVGYLHDVGKIGVPDSILGKKGQLTPEEWKLMKKHPITSAKILEPVRISSVIKAAIRHHHERFDGRGYPYGLAGESIPLEARIIAVVDAYEAMTSDRPYRKALSDEEAVAELKRCSGTQFDPACVDAFLAALGRLPAAFNDQAGGYHAVAG